MSRRIGSGPESPNTSEETNTAAPAEMPAFQQPDSSAAALAAAEPKKRHTGLWITLAALLTAAGIGGYFMLSTPKAVAAYDEHTQILDDGTFYQGVSITGVDVSGMTVDEARQAIQDKAKQEMSELSVTYTVDGEEYTLGAEQLGAAIDTETVLNRALELGRLGPFDKRHGEIATARDRGTNYEIAFTYDENSIADVVAEQLAPLADSAKNAAVVVNTTSDEGSKRTGYSIEYTDEEPGIAVEQEKLVSDILTAVQNGSTEPVVAETTVREPEITRDMLEGQYAVRGIYKTSYGDSAEGRRYNIWKMSDTINGVEIGPGDTWSINEEAGPRTYDRGWKGAPGISDGEYQTEAGGGICQVSSTLYNAVLRAEVDVAERTHHSWPLGYVPGGLDATISTGAPDFKIHNNLDVPIFIAVNCDGESGRTVEVAIIGPEIGDGLTRDFYSELVGTKSAGGVQEVYDSSLPAGTRQTIIQAHEGKTYKIYKRYYDADGNQVGEDEYFMTDTYAPKPAKVRVGTGRSYTPSVSRSDPDPEPAQADDGGGGDEGGGDDAAEE
ncbi:MAG: hypothetical protein HDQ87_07355 [Clostridia bacterium]|nr:hypothetical protein [Clostridia bacterium]